jgi:RNA polymerase sigma-70 factor (ECF subfamily)
MIFRGARFMTGDDQSVALNHSNDSDVDVDQEMLSCFRAGQLDVSAMTQKFRDRLKGIAAQELPESLRFRMDDSDLVQESLVRAVRSANEFRGTTESELEQWLRGILKNQLIDSIRFHHRQQRDVARDLHIAINNLKGKEETPSEVVSWRESCARLWAIVEDLPEDYQEVILLRQQMDLSFAEIGQRMGRSADAVRMLWGRAVLMLGQKLKEAAERAGE